LLPFRVRKTVERLSVQLRFVRVHDHFGVEVVYPEIFLPVVSQAFNPRYRHFLGLPDVKISCLDHGLVFGQHAERRLDNISEHCLFSAVYRCFDPVISPDHDRRYADKSRCTQRKHFCRKLQSAHP